MRLLLLLLLLLMMMMMLEAAGHRFETKSSEAVGNRPSVPKDFDASVPARGIVQRKLLHAGYRCIGAANGRAKWHRSIGWVHCR